MTEITIVIMPIHEKKWNLNYSLMKIPEKSCQLISDALISKSLLEKAAVEGLIDSLRQEKSVNWNLILTKQFESEHGGTNETED